MRTIQLPDGTRLPNLGVGTWHMGNDPAKEQSEIAAIQKSIASGLTVIDTAEQYGAGASERLVRKAITGIDRDKVFLISKVLPSNAGKANIFSSCDATLQRLGVNNLDLYLLHWRGSVPLMSKIWKICSKPATVTTVP